MRKILSAALLSLLVVGSTLSSVSAAELDNSDTHVTSDAFDASSLSNQNPTLDDAQNDGSPAEDHHHPA